MIIENKGDYVIVNLPEKTVKLRGHQDEDSYRIFTESIETNAMLSDCDIKEIKNEIAKHPDYTID